MKWYSDLPGDCPGALILSALYPNFGTAISWTTYHKVGTLAFLSIRLSQKQDTNRNRPPHQGLLVQRSGLVRRHGASIPASSQASATPGGSGESPGYSAAANAVENPPDASDTPADTSDVLAATPALQFRGPVVPMVVIAPAELDEHGLQISIRDLQNIVGQLEAYRLQTEAYRDLQSDHEVLLRDHASLRREITAARAALLRAEQHATPFVSFCQRRYDLVHNRLEDTQLHLAENRSVLEVRRDNSLEIACLGVRLQAHQRLHEDVVEEFHRRMIDLETRLVVFGPSNAARIAQITAERDAALTERDAVSSARDAVIAERDAAKEESNVLSGEVQTQSAALRDAENASRLLRQQIASMGHQITDLHAQLHQGRVSAARPLELSLKMRDELQQKLDQATHDLAGKQESLTKALQAHDRLQKDLYTDRLQLDSQRTRIANLERQVGASSQHELDAKRLEADKFCSATISWRRAQD